MTVVIWFQLIEVAATQSPALPAGVLGVAFGQAQRFKDAAGKEMCAIVKPLGHPPAFDRGVREVSYAVLLRAGGVKSASTQVVLPAGRDTLRRTPCHQFAPVKGGFSQTQIGTTLSRADGGPLSSGAYMLRITVDGQVAEVPFTVR